MTEITNEQITQFIAQNSDALNFTYDSSDRSAVYSLFKALDASLNKPRGIDNDDNSYYQGQIGFFLQPKDESRPVASYEEIKTTFYVYTQSLDPKVQEPLQVVEEVNEVEAPAPTKQSFLSKLGFGRRSSPVNTAASVAAAAVVAALTPIEESHAENMKPITPKEYTQKTGLLKTAIGSSGFLLETPQYNEIAAGRTAVLELLGMLPDAANVPDIDTRSDFIKAIEAKLTVLLQTSPAINQDMDYIPSAKGLIADYSRKAGLTEVVEAVVGQIPKLSAAQSTEPKVNATQTLAQDGRQQG